MPQRAQWRLESLLDSSAPLCLALALVILSLTGVGNVKTASLAGLILCGAGLTREAAMASSWAAFGNIVDGYGAMHGLFPVLYLLASCLDGREQRLLRSCCLLWAGAAAVAGIGRFAFQVIVQGWAVRMSGLLGNPNAMGIFLVMGWFLLMHCDEEDRRPGLLRLEPVLLMALALTLSMGSFAAMAAGIVVLLLERKQSASWRETVRFICPVLARAVLGVGTGLLTYLAAARTGVPWLCLLPLAYGGAAAAGWGSFRRWLNARPPMALLIASAGFLVAAAAVAVRPSAAATFSERLEMMASGLRYLPAEPLWGVGPLRWRLLDLNDGGKYFNTWHIHNIPLHVGVEMGWIAMAAIVLAGLRGLGRKQSPPLRAGTAAFLFHNLMDTSFFYLGITALALTAESQPEAGGRTLGGRAVKAVFALFGLLLLYSLYFDFR